MHILCNFEAYYLLFSCGKQHFMYICMYICLLELHEMYNRHFSLSFDFWVHTIVCPIRSMTPCPFVGFSSYLARLYPLRSKCIAHDFNGHRLTHWGRVMHICVNKLTIIGSDNGLSPGRRQAIIWTNAGILLIGPLGTNFSEILIEMYTFSFKKMHLKMSSGKWRPCCLGLTELRSHGFEVSCRIPWLFRLHGSFDSVQFLFDGFTSYLDKYKLGIIDVPCIIFFAKRAMVKITWVVRMFWRLRSGSGMAAIISLVLLFYLTHLENCWFRLVWITV